MIIHQDCISFLITNISKKEKDGEGKPGLLFHSAITDDLICILPYIDLCVHYSFGNVNRGREDSRC